MARVGKAQQAMSARTGRRWYQKNKKSKSGTFGRAMKYQSWYRNKKTSILRET